MAAGLKQWFLVGILAVNCNGQPTNIYDALQPFGCGQFLAILNKCDINVVNQYKENVRWTVFAPNDTAFNTLPPARRAALDSMTPTESENYVKSFTLHKDLLTTYFRDTEPEQSGSRQNTVLFLRKRARKEGNSASGVAGTTEYYVNGALILKPNKQAGQAIIHVIDRVLEVPSDKSILGYISLAGQPDTAFFDAILSKIIGHNYDLSVEPLNSYQHITAFIPTKQALAKIPSDKKQSLLSNPERLSEVARQHIIADRVMYTSFVYHNEGVNSLGKGQVIFRTNTAREAVFVNSGGVTAQITHGNITCKNGAVHFVDTLLGFIYNSAKDEIDLSPMTQRFEDLLVTARNELNDMIVSPSGVTMFVPVNDAFVNLPAFYNLNRNQSLINKIVELCLLERGYSFQLTTVNGDYMARQTLVSQYYRRPVNVYSQGNETWIESGYVKARVVRPDIGVTNGFIHFIDAIPGAPNRDVPNTIFCEDWLIKSSLQLTLTVTGLNDFMRDGRVSTIAPCTTGGGVRSSPNVYSNNFNTQSGKRASIGSPCAGNCQFTVFIPNGTAIEYFEDRDAGRYIQGNIQRWQHVLARHITRQVIYLDQITVGQERTYRALNGDEVRYRRATPTYTYVYFQGQLARVLHSDLGATNGVVHIIDQVIFVSDDMYRTSFNWNYSGTSTRHLLSDVFLFVLFIHVAWHWLRLG
ncbi:hypothetical protein ACOMHN_022430 [Nucella lapillus]